MVDVTIHDDTIDTIDAIDAIASTWIDFKCIQGNTIKKYSPSPSNDQSHF